MNGEKSGPLASTVRGGMRPRRRAAQLCVAIIHAGGVLDQDFLGSCRESKLIAIDEQAYDDVVQL
jgi:hypothetical protein